MHKEGAPACRVWIRAIRVTRALAKRAATRPVVPVLATPHTYAHLDPHGVFKHLCGNHHQIARLGTHHNSILKAMLVIGLHGLVDEIGVGPLLHDADVWALERRLNWSRECQTRERDDQHR